MTRYERTPASRAAVFERTLTVSQHLCIECHMRLMLIVLTLTAFAIWDVRLNHSQYTGPFFAPGKQIFR